MNKPRYVNCIKHFKVSLLIAFSIFCNFNRANAQSCSPYQPVIFSTPTAVLGNGTASSCTETALKAALVNGGNVSCNCGPTPVTIPVTSTITIAKTTVLDGKGLVTLDGQGTSRFFSKNPAAEFTIQNLNMINGRADDKGGAIVCNNSGFFPAERLILINCNFTNNTCAKVAGQDIGGGAIYQLLLKELVVSGCTFTKNTGSNGGAIGGIGSDITVINSTFTENQATGQNDLSAAPYGGIGGAIYTDNVHLYGVNHRFLLCNSKFINNSSHIRGGAIHNVFHDNTKSKFIVDKTLFSGNYTRSTTDGTGGAIYHQEDAIVDNLAEDNVEITNSTFTKNYTAGQGGAIWTLIRGNGKISNCTFEGNKTTVPGGSLGGALVVNTGFYSVENTTLANNRSEYFGAAIFAGNDVNTKVTLKNSIISNNTYGFEWIGQCNGTYIDGGGNIQWPRKRPNGSDDGLCAAGVTFVDPLLSPIADNGGGIPTMALQATSPAINKGINCASTTDQRGFARVGICDIGAFEYSGTLGNIAPSVSITSPTNNSTVAQGNTVTINTNATDADGTVAKVEFFQGTTKLGEDLTSPFSFIWTPAAAGTYNITAKATDNIGAATTSSIISLSVTNVPIVNCSASGTITRDVWTNVSGTSIPTGLLTTAPTTTTQLNIFEGPVNSADNYLSRVRGYICPPTTGDYIFWIASDDNGELWLSADSTEPNKRRIASITGWTNSREWLKSTSQQSVAISLTAGRKYYIEALHKEGGGGDNLAVGWQLPNGTQERPIPGTRLSPFVTTPVTPIGTGLSAIYYDNIDFTGTTLARTDATVNFDWQYGSPATTLGTEQFSARWTGKVKPKYTGTYTFFTLSDDGVRLWVNNQLLVDNWTNHGPTENSGTILLTADQQYDIRLEYFENSGGAVCKLSWSSASQTKEIIPQSQLYSPATAARLGDFEETLDGLVVYPNPTLKDFTITYKGKMEEIVTWEIQDVTGKLVFKASTPVREGMNEINYNEGQLKHGTYVLILKNNEGTSSKKLIVL